MNKESETLIDRQLNELSSLLVDDIRRGDQWKIHRATGLEGISTDDLEEYMENVELPKDYFISLLNNDDYKRIAIMEVHNTESIKGAVLAMLMDSFGVSTESGVCFAIHDGEIHKKEVIK